MKLGYYSVFVYYSGLLIILSCKYVLLTIRHMSEKVNCGNKYLNLTLACCTKWIFPLAWIV